MNSNSNISLDIYGIHKAKINYNLSISDLYETSISKNLGQLTNDGVLSINTGKFTGRSPKDRYIVKDEITAEKVWWGDINLSFDKDMKTITFDIYSSLDNNLLEILIPKNLINGEFTFLESFIFISTFQKVFFFL